MYTHPSTTVEDTIAFSIGPLHVRWYGLMYLTAFVLFVLLARWRLKSRDGQPSHFARTTGLVPNDVEDLLFYGVLGVILGGRLGYVLFYKPGFYLSNPIELFKVWEGGLSFHGGLIGVLLMCALFARKRGIRYLDLMDFVAPQVPIGLAAGRLGNWINGELWGRVTDVPWAVIFPHARDGLPRHPSQLYQLAGEGLLLFAILWWYSSKPRARGDVSGFFLIGYGAFRFLAEFAREPDAFLGPVLGPFTMGQVLCVPMFIAGGWLMWRSRRLGVSEPASLS